MNSTVSLPLPHQVRLVVDGYLEIVDALIPRLLEGLYLVGSVALGDFCPRQSDIDFVAVTQHPLDAQELTTLAHVHTRLRQRWRRPYFDGTYVTWDQLSIAPAFADSGAFTHESHFYAQGSGERHPVTWHTLARYGVVYRGPAVGNLELWQDPDVLADWTDANLDSYWRHVHTRNRHLFTRAGLASLSAWSCAWCVLGVSRLHYTLATGDITSKAGAGKYAWQTYAPRWNKIIAEALRIHRSDSGPAGYGSPFARRRDTLSFLDMVIADAHGLYAQRKRSPARSAGISIEEKGASGT